MGLKDRKERDFRRREHEILAAALKLSGKDDWLWVTIEQIAAAAEIGKGTVYKHFRTKDEIYARLALDFHAGVLERLRQLPPAQGFGERLRAFLRVFWDAYKVGVAYQRVVQYCEREDFRRELSAPLRKAFDELDRSFGEVTAGLVGAGITEGLLPESPSPFVLFGAQSALYGGLRLGWSGCMQGKDDEQYFAELAAFVEAGLTRTSNARR